MKIYRQTKNLLRRLIKDHRFEETLFPRIPVPVQKDMLKKLEEHDKMFKQVRSFLLFISHIQISYSFPFFNNRILRTKGLWQRIMVQKSTSL